MDGRIGVVLVLCRPYRPAVIYNRENPGLQMSLRSIFTLGCGRYAPPGLMMVLHFVNFEQPTLLAATL